MNIINLEGGFSRTPPGYGPNIDRILVSIFTHFPHEDFLGLYSSNKYNVMVKNQKLLSLLLLQFV